MKWVTAISHLVTSHTNYYNIIILSYYNMNTLVKKYNKFKSKKINKFISRKNNKVKSKKINKFKSKKYNKFKSKKYNKFKSKKNNKKNARGFSIFTNKRGLPIVSVNMPVIKYNYIDFNLLKSNYSSHINKPIRITDKKNTKLYIGTLTDIIDHPDNISHITEPEKFEIEIQNENGKKEVIEYDSKNEFEFEIGTKTGEERVTILKTSPRSPPPKRSRKSN